jgi:hypothetical protein
LADAKAEYQALNANAGITLEKRIRLAEEEEEVEVVAADGEEVA